MSFSSTVGRNSRPRSKLDVVSTGQSTISETMQVPNTFHFWNGDEYAGQFTFSKDKQKVVMEGRGVYSTSDGQSYEGLWEDDYLKHDCKIRFADKSVFFGSLEEMTMQGFGKYKFKENVQIEGELVNNAFVGKVYLRDPQQRLWKAEVSTENDILIFFPLHTFWQSVLNVPSKSPQCFYGEAAEETENIWEEIY